MFQPAEETFEGARDMISAGVLKNPDVDGAMMTHVMANMPFPVGTAIVSSAGVSAPAADYFTVEVQGKGCHGSMPNMGVDPLSVSAHILISLQEINARELALSENAVLTIGTMQAGTAANVIPDRAVMSGSIRTFDEDARNFIKRRIQEISEGTASAFRAKANVSFGSGCPTLVNDGEMSSSVEKYMKELLGKKAMSVSDMRRAASENQGAKNENDGGRVETSAKNTARSAGSEDFAYVTHEVPSVMVALAAGEPSKGYCYPQHHPKTQFDESVLPVGAAAYAYAAIRWLQEHN
jgi:hippurate hydrolase